MGTWHLQAQLVRKTDWSKAQGKLGWAFPFPHQLCHPKHILGRGGGGMKPTYLNFPGIL